MTREERRAATRTELLDAASRVFARRGFHAATLEDLAREAGYTTGAIYSNFTGKDELFRAAFEHQIARDVREVSEAQAAATEDTPGARTRDEDLPEDALEQMSAAMLTGIREWTREGRKPRRGR